MHLKRFRAPTIGEALRQVREELGEEAVILHTKAIPLVGALPFARRQAVEVVAALDDDPPSRVRGAKDERRKAGSEVREAKGEVPDFTATDRESAMLTRELQQVKGMLSGLLGRGHLPPDLPDRLNQMYWSLLAQEVDEGVARRWVIALRDENPTQGSAEPSSLCAGLADILAKEMPRAESRVGAGARRVVALVGPTGVGKTTTVAKLAAWCRFRENKRVALITTDTYRIAGPQQLKTYADLMGLPFCVASVPGDLRRALGAAREADVIFVDTVGRSPRRKDQVEELKAYVSDTEGCEVRLVLSATTKRADLLEAVEGYRPMGFCSIIATKIDETLSVGPVVEASLRAAIPITYLTTGQEVPDDIEEAHPLRLAERLAGVA